MIATDVIEEYERALENLRREGRAAFLIRAQKIFWMHSELEYFEWNQYTPYFNDGSVCTFSANTGNFIVKLSEEKEPLDPDDIWEILNEEKTVPDVVTSLCRDIDNLLGSISIGTYEVLFGDHAEVQVREDQVLVTYYAHD